MKIFMDNLKYIEDFNARENRTMTLGLNAFSDLVSIVPKLKVSDMRFNLNCDFFS